MKTGTTFPQFDKYACEGDRIEWTRDGFDFVARLQYDTDTKPTDFDCYSPDDVRRWKNDEWCYVGVVLSVSRNGVKLSDHAASLWGVTCNFGADNAYLADVVSDLEDDALETARSEVTRIKRALGV